VYVYDEYVHGIDDDIGVKVYVYDEYVRVLDDDIGVKVYVYDECDLDRELY
jgi:hypothetical protein